MIGSRKHRYIWGYTLGALSILLGLVLSGFDWSWISTTEYINASLSDVSRVFWFGMGLFIAGCLVMFKTAIGWYLLYFCLGVAGWQWLDWTLFPIGDDYRWQTIDAFITLGIFVCLAIQIWYWRRFRRSLK